MDMEYLGEETTRIGYPVLPVVKEVVRLANEEKPGLQLGEWAHWGATTQVRIIYVLQDTGSHAI
jgi:3-carboxy-cis,cis-muconate cycloisomerase